MIIWNDSPQGSEAWREIRRGAITGSRAKDARDFKQPTKAQAAQGLRGESSAKREGYAMDLARQRCGGTVLDAYVNAEMRIGSDRESDGRILYEDRTGNLVEERGFAHTEDGKFGASVDGLINDDGIFENKVMVSSATLFRCLVDGDITDFRDQCLFEMWLLSRKWVDLMLYVYDLPQLSRVIRIDRDESEIEAFEADMLAFERLVSDYEAMLRGRPTSSDSLVPILEASLAIRAAANA